MDQALLNTAIALHQQGEFAQAEKAYRAVLAHDPKNADALALLGCVLSEQKKHDAALNALHDALRIDAAAPLFHFHLGNAHMKAGDALSAEKALMRAVELAHDWPDALYNLGNAQRLLNKTEAAKDTYLKVVALNASHALAHNNLALLHLKAQRFDLARAHIEQALNVSPHDPQLWLSLSDIASEQNDYETAFMAACAALEVRLRIPGGDVTRILAHDFSDGFDEPLINTLLALAVGHMVRGRFVEAGALIRLLLSHEPDMEEGLSLLGSLALARNNLDMADEAYAQSFMLDPSYIGAPWNRAMVLLTQNKMQDGFKRYRWRWQALDKLKSIALNAPMWDGGDLAGKTLLVHEEQGFGDSLQMLRFMPMLKALGATVWFYARPPLVPLLVNCPGIDRVIAWGKDGRAPPEGTDLICGVMDLPGLLNISPAALPAAAPYVPNPKAGDASYQLEGGSRLKVGLVWSGNPLHKRDHERSIPLAMLKPLMKSSAQFFSLQFKAKESDLHLMREWGITDLAPKVKNLADSAAFLKNLDLLITVDSAPAHLAGALGVKVWTLVTLNPDWRWLLEREDSPWYPSLRLFRQKKAGDWDYVVQSLETALVAETAGKH